MIRLAAPLVVAAAVGWMAMPRSAYIALPRPDLTPGAVIMNATAINVCEPGWARHIREQRDERTWRLAKREIMRAYGYGDRRSSDFELDHLVPLEVGGSNDWRNLWPQPIAEAREKDRDEDILHGAVCAGLISLKGAQDYFISMDWAK